MADNYDYMRIGNTEYFYNIPYLVDAYPEEMIYPDDTDQETIDKIQNSSKKSIYFTFELWRNNHGDKSYKFFYTITGTRIMVYNEEFLNNIDSNEEKLRILTDYLKTHVIGIDQELMDRIIENREKEIKREQESLEQIKYIVAFYNKK